MHEVAIIGAGELGGALALALARLDVTRVVRLLDENGRVAEGKALDIAQAAPVERFATQIVGASDLSYAATADVILVADRFGDGEWPPDQAVMLLRRFVRMTRAPIVCAGSGAASLVQQGVDELKIPRERLIGTAPEALAAAARALVGVAANASPQDVALLVLGRPPTHTIVAWTASTLGGFALTAQLDEPTRRRLDARIDAVWPPGPLALAAAAARVVACLEGTTRQLVSCFIAPDTSTGRRARVCALPVRLGPDGVAKVVMPSLSAGEQVALDNALLI